MEILNFLQYYECLLQFFKINPKNKYYYTGLNICFGPYRGTLKFRGSFWRPYRRWAYVLLGKIWVKEIWGKLSYGKFWENVDLWKF